jgi:cell division transport system ATP-binding protein
MSQAVLSLKNVTIYQEGKSILSEVNLRLNTEFLYIHRKTGSGKSSLMKTYMLIYLTEGEGNIVDYDLAKRR